MFNVIDIIVVVIILISAFLGYKKGFVKSAINLVSFFVAIGLALMFYKPLAVILTENTQIDDWVVEKIISSQDEENIQELENGGTIGNQQLENGNSESTTNTNAESNVDNANSPNAGNNTNSENGSNNENGGNDNNLNTETALEENNIMTAIGNLPATLLESFNFEEIKENAKEEIAYKISELIMNLLSLIIIYIVVKITLAIAAFVLNGIMKFPVLKQLNEVLGLTFGGIMGVLQIYVVFAIITFISSICDISVAINMIKASAFASALFENNLIIHLLF